MTNSTNIIKTFGNYVSGVISANVAAENLGISRRSFFRKVKLWKEEGIVDSVHGNKGKQSKRKLSSELREKILKLVKEKYFDLPFKEIARHMDKDEGIHVSDETIRKIVREEEKEKVIKIQKNPHPSRRRRNRFGELIQIDGSPHHWFGDEKPEATLIAFIDDATGKITAARFEPQEDGVGYQRAIYAHVSKYGIPLAFYSDNHSVFHPVNEAEKGKTSLTQYQRICQILGIETIYATTPQAKGRIERLNRTLQGRWPGEFRLRGIDTIEKANAVVEELIEEFNKEFSSPPIDPSDAHVPCSEQTPLRLICATWHERIISKSRNISWNNQIVQLDSSYETLFLVGFKAIIAEYDNGDIEVYVRKKKTPTVLERLRFRILDRRQKVVVKEYEETAKTIDTRITKLIEEKRENAFVKNQMRWGEKRQKLKKKREETTRAANMLEEKVAANK